jgi:protein gp37
VADQKNGIAWCDQTWNPIRGCSRVSAGCVNCYAERVAARFSDEGQPYHGLADRTRSGSKWTGEVRMVEEHLADPLRWKKPRRIFVNSMSDLFHEKLTNEQIAAVFGVMAASPQHTFQVLTKRAKRMREWFGWMHSDPLVKMNMGVSAYMTVPRAVAYREPHDQAQKWPLPNVWLGVSVENQAAADERIPELLATPATVRFLSCEPLIGAVDLTEISEWRGEPLSALEECVGHIERPRIDWVIAGCESGPGARPCEVAWLRDLRDQCASSGVAYFLKQATGTPGELAEGCVVTWVVGADTGSKQKSGGVIELPYLDGVQHIAFPEVRS